MSAAAEKILAAHRRLRHATNDAQRAAAIREIAAIVAEVRKAGHGDK